MHIWTALQRRHVSDEGVAMTVDSDDRNVPFFRHKRNVTYHENGLVKFSQCLSWNNHFLLITHQALGYCINRMKQDQFQDPSRTCLVVRDAIMYISYILTCELTYNKYVWTIHHSKIGKYIFCAPLDPPTSTHLILIVWQQWTYFCYHFLLRQSKP